MNSSRRLIQNEFNFDNAMRCVSEIGKASQRNQAVDCVIHSLAATDFLTIQDAISIAPIINFTKINKGILMDQIILFLGDKLHKKIDLFTFTRDQFIIQYFLRDIEIFLYQHLATNHATPISYDSLILRQDTNGNSIREPALGHNVVVINSFKDGIIIMDTQQNIADSFQSYFVKQAPNVYNINLYFESDLPDSAMDVVADPFDFTKGGKHKVNKKRKSTMKRKSKRRKHEKKKLN